MRLYLIRHAESANNALYAQTGSWHGRNSDPEITERGHRQSQRLGQLIANPDAETINLPFEKDDNHSFGLTHLYCSLMTRSILTAHYVAEACQLPLKALPHTHERGGIYDLHRDGTKTGLAGRKRSYFTTRWPTLQLPDSVTEDGWYQRPFETNKRFLGRVQQAVSDLLNWHQGSQDRVALVAHGDFIDQFVNNIMGMPHNHANDTGDWAPNWAHNNTSITRIDMIQERKVMIYLNRVDHLTPELVTW